MSLRDGYEEETGGAVGVFTVNSGSVNGREQQKGNRFSHKAIMTPHPSVFY